MTKPGPIRLTPLDAESFAPFGRVIGAGAPSEGFAVNQGRARRYDLDHPLGRFGPADRLALATYRVEASAMPIAVDVVERHPFSEQLFVPMTARSYLVLVVPEAADGSPAWDEARALEARPDQGVVYRAGVWHRPLAALGAPADFHMCMWETGAGDDTEVRTSPPGLVVVA